MSMQEIALDALLAAGFAVLAVLALQARKSRAAAVRDVEAERSLREQLGAQADALDHLLAATTGLADELDEGRLLERIAEEALQLVSAECGLVIERAGNRCTVVTSAPLGQAWRPGPLDAVNVADLARRIALNLHGAADLALRLPLPAEPAAGAPIAADTRPSPTSSPTTAPTAACRGRS